MKIIMVFPFFPHGVLVIPYGVELLFHVDLPAPVSTRKGKNTRLDIRLKPQKTGVARSRNADSGPDFVHQLETFFMIGHLGHVQGQVNGTVLSGIDFRDNLFFSFLPEN
jgi:hypothetical protein